MAILCNMTTAAVLRQKNIRPGGADILMMQNQSSFTAPHWEQVQRPLLSVTQVCSRAGMRP